MDRLILLLLITIAVGCSNESPTDNSSSLRIIEVLLKGGGSVVLVCPTHTGIPLGSDGRECYIDEDLTTTEVNDND